ncbi:MAG: PilZ domain-containing protein, partial [Candidatus Eremiobacteraeota bacterium]|nr:PilZ domain-containing protein [Candidatus Eremiobacteraeota bacterium]
HTVDNQQNSAQRRQFDRARVNLPVSYSLVGKGGSAQARVVDLSGGGARIATAADLAAGTQLELTFRLRETDAQLVARGRIIMSFFEGSEQRYLHGVAFTQIAPADQEAIVQYIHEVQFPKLYGITRP